MTSNKFPTMKDHIRLTKLDAARRQLQTGIDLWFHDKDPISIHLLAFSSHEIIHRLFRNAGHRDLLFDSTLIKDEYRSEYARFLKRTASFLKNADTDPNAIETFNPESNHIFLTMSVVALLRMGVQMNDIELGLNFWNIIHHTHWFGEYVAQKSVDIEKLPALREIEKGRFLECFMQARMM